MVIVERGITIPAGWSRIPVPAGTGMIFAQGADGYEIIVPVKPPSEISDGLPVLEFGSIGHRLAFIKAHQRDGIDYSDIYEPEPGRHTVPEGIE
jgi:hypothetical protein